MMTDNEAKELASCYVEDEKEAELTARAVKFVANRMQLAKSVCNRLFGDNVAEVEDVYTMYDYLNRETATQLLIMTGEKAMQSLEAAKLRAKAEEDLN